MIGIKATTESPAPFDAAECLRERDKAASSKRWEYRVERLIDGKDAETRLSEIGLRGWELVAVAVQFTTHVCYLKREMWP